MSLKRLWRDIDNKYYCFLVFVYDINLPYKEPIIYSSINKALKGLQISYSTLLNHIFNNYIFKSNFILSFEPKFKDAFGKYCFVDYDHKPSGDNQLRKHITVYNKDNEIVTAAFGA